MDFDYVLTIGVEPTGDVFNAIILDEQFPLTIKSNGKCLRDRARQV